MDGELTFNHSWTITNETTTHASRLLPTFSSSETITWLYELNCGIDSSFPCPLPLLVELVNINILRRQRNDLTSGVIPSSWRTAAFDLLKRIKKFELHDWIDSKQELRREWSLIIRTYHAAVALFALAALTEGLDAKSLPKEVNDFRVVQRKLLFSLLRKAWRIPTLKFNLLWPAMVAGFEAAKGSKGDRDFIDRYLFNMGEEMAIASPLHGRVMLKRFWKSYKEQWDDCFDAAYCFTL